MLRRKPQAGAKATPKKQQQQKTKPQQHKRKLTTATATAQHPFTTSHFTPTLTSTATKHSFTKASTHKRPALLTTTKRRVSLYQIPTPAGQIQQNFEPNPSIISELLGKTSDGASVHSTLQADLDENISHGSIDFANGRVVFDARSSLHNFVRFRVMEHRKTHYTNQEEGILQTALTDLALDANQPAKVKKATISSEVDPDQIYYSFQEVYDDGDEECQDPYINLKSVIKAGSDNVTTLHLSSASAVMGGVSFSTHSPNNILYVGNWGGVLPQYMGAKIGSDVEIIDPDAMSQYMSKTYSPGIFFENFSEVGIATAPRPKIGFAKDTPDHPFDIIFAHKMGLVQRHTAANNITNQDQLLALLDQDGLQMSPDAASPTTSSTTAQTESDEMERAHTQLQLQESLVAFQHARSRNNHTGNISMHPPAIDTNSHLSSLYSQHYLEPTQAIPTAIQYIQHHRHFKHLQSQLEQNRLNIKAMVLEKWDLKPFIYGLPTHPQNQFKRQYDLLVQDVVSLRFKIQQLMLEMQELAQGDTNTETMTQNANKLKSALEHVQTQLESKQTALNEVVSILDSTSPTPAELQHASEQVSKWLGRRFIAIQDFSDNYQDIDLEDIYAADHDTIEDTHVNTKTYSKRMDEIFDQGEEQFALDFNRQFITLMISDQEDGDVDDGDLLGTNPEEFDGNNPDTDAIRLNPTSSAPANTRLVYERALEDPTVDGVMFQSAFFTLERYEKALKKHQKTSDELQVKMNQLNLDPAVLPVLASIHENILDSILLPMRGYDAIVHDHNTDPLTPDTLRLIKEALILEGSDNALRHGMFVKRFSLLDPQIAESSFEGIVDYLPDINHTMSQITKAFKHVYWQQPSHDNLVVMATDSPLAGNLQSKHPLEPDEMIDISVSLWQAGVIGLDVVETSDAWSYISKNSPELETFAQNLVHDPFAFLPGAAEDQQM